MVALRAAISERLSVLAAGIVSDEDDADDIAGRVASMPSLAASDFATETLSIMRVIAESVEEPADFDLIASVSDFTGETLSAWLVVSAFGLAIAGCRIAWPSRPAARSARAQIAEAGRLALAEVSAKGGAGADLYGWLQSVIAVACRYVSDIAANAAPLVRVETAISLPSTVLAYQLYGDATRAGGLVDVAKASTPMVMPSAFDAIKR